MQSNLEQIKLSDVADALDPPQIRVDGWHVTNLIAEALAIAKGKRAEPFNPPENIMGLISMGRIWEPSVKPWLSQYAAMLGLDAVYGSRDEPLEMWKDDILGNLDAVLLDNGKAIAVVDMKYTMGKPDMTENFSSEKYLHQMKAYCSMMQCQEAWFLTLNIPKAGSLACNFYRQQLLFTKQEIQDTWKMILKTRDYLEAIGV
jgi:hypothetical protein